MDRWGATNYEWREGAQKGDISISAKSNSAFPCISAQPLSEPLLNMHTTSYMSVIMYLDSITTQSYLGSSHPYICDDMELPYTKGHTSNL